MRKAILAALATTMSLAISTTASAAIFGGSNVDFGTTPFTFGISGNNFTLSYNPQGAFDIDPVFLQTSGTAAVTAAGGFPGFPLVPSPAFVGANTFGPDSFPGYASFTTPTAVPFSIVDGDLGLRVTVGSDNFYGYARFAGSMLESFAFESNANQAITAPSVAAVPEPATWAMMIGGFGLIGGTMRSRRRQAVRVKFAI